MSKPITLLALLLANAVPVIGVFFWVWRSFDLIYLYWFENVLIGIFCLLRMVVRPYSHPIELAWPLFIGPFFLLHYGAFTSGHGVFVISLFGNGYPAQMSDLKSLLAPLFAEPNLLFAAGALFIYQAFDWLHQTARRGLGSEGIKELMFAPYRRIIVLHLTILAGGFALEALNEPTIGLLLLVAIKLGFDIYHLDQDEKSADALEDIDIEAEIEELSNQYPEPKVTVNGKDKHFASFAEMSRSREWGMLLTVLRFMGLSRELKAMNTYMRLRIEQENVTDA